MKDAKAYAVSWALYGAYGGTNKVLSPEWKSHEVICGVWDWRPDPVFLPNAEEHTDAPPDDYFEAIHSAHSTMANAVRTREASMAEATAEARKLELDALISARVRPGLAPAKARSLASSRDDLLAEMDSALVKLFEPKSIAECADRSNQLANDFLASAAQILDPADFKVSFDVDPGTQVVVVAPQIVSKWVANTSSD